MWLVIDAVDADVSGIAVLFPIPPSPPPPPQLANKDETARRIAVSIEKVDFDFCELRMDIAVWINLTLSDLLRSKGSAQV